MVKFREKFKKQFRKKVAKGKKRFFIQIEKLKDFKFRYLNLHILLVALIFLLIFIGFDLFLRTFNLYYYAYWVDIPSHIFAGMALAALAIWLLHFTKGKYKNSSVMISVFVASLTWEIIEITGDILLPDTPWMMDYFFWDGFFDVLITLISGAIFIWFFNRYIKVKLKKRIHKDFSRAFPRQSE